MAYLTGCIRRSERHRAVGRIIFTGELGWFYYVVQITPDLILVLAANTSFADFPRLRLAGARRFAAPFASRGTAVFSNGIVIIAIFPASCRGLGGDTSDDSLTRRSLPLIQLSRPAWCATGSKSATMRTRKE